MSQAQTTRSSSPRADAAQQQGRKIQREVEAVEAKPFDDSQQGPKAMQAGTREYPTEFPAQHHAKPGLESEVRPAPMYDAPGYKGSEKLKGKVALITGGDSGIGRAVAVLSMPSRDLSPVASWNGESGSTQSHPALFGRLSIQPTKAERRSRISVISQR